MKTMSDNAASGATATTRIILACSGSIDDGRDYFDREFASVADYYISRQGEIYQSSYAPQSGTITVMLANVGPVILVNYQPYPIRLDRNSMPEPDIAQPPVGLFYEFCQLQKFKGFQHFESYTTQQLHSLKHLLLMLSSNHNIPSNFDLESHAAAYRFKKSMPGIYLNSLINRCVLTPHPQPDLIKIIQQIPQ